MTWQFLKSICGDSRGRLHEWMHRWERKYLTQPGPGWIDFKPIDPLIAWYPSGGMDFRDVLHMSVPPPSTLPEQCRPRHRAPADFFLHSDPSPTIKDSLMREKILDMDLKRMLWVSEFEELPAPSEPFSARWLFFEVEIHEDDNLVRRCPVIYAFCEDQTMAALANQHRIRFAHIVRSAEDGTLWCYPRQ